MLRQPTLTSSQNQPGKAILAYVDQDLLLKIGQAGQAAALPQRILGYGATVYSKRGDR